MTVRKVTITDVAQEAGVSVATVSLVLSGKGRISQKTADKVNATIEALGYVRNQQAAFLRDNVSNVIGLIIPDLTSPFYSEVASGISRYLETHNKIVFLTQSGNSRESFNLCLDSLISYGVDGIIVGGGSYLNQDIQQRLARHHIPVVCAARASECSGIDIIRPDNTLAAKIATEHLINNGHHQIAYFGGEGHSLTRAERIGGYCSTLIQYGLPFKTEWIIDVDNKQQHIIEKMTDFLHQYPKVSAVICHNTATALGAYLGALKIGNTISSADNYSYFNQEITLLGFDDIGSEALYDIPVSFITQPAREIGINAASRIIQRMNDSDSAPQSVLLAPGFSQLKS
ncbi:Mal regulon transcriptional regulator MalI [uncultured Cedecea sp.]|uniref:Mal regulon transcriptional regulator MalI n=1 Tax=uncultured Cedecea sp. TaxID=988762 RepID=UPI00260D52D5|nr:Mal regulon transcriptional regulator MalI [uncultured Cedecea sp.]